MSVSESLIAARFEGLEQRVKELEAWHGIYGQPLPVPVPEGRKVWLIFANDGDEMPWIRRTLEDAKFARSCGDGRFIREAILLGRVE